MSVTALDPITSGDDHVAPDQAPVASARVGMVGAGQLARMTQRAAIDLGVHLEVLAGDPTDPAVLAGAPHRWGRPDDPDALWRLASAVDVLTFDHELVDLAQLEHLVAAGRTVRPGPAALAMAVDKLHARRRLGALGFPVPAHRPVDDVDDVAALATEHGWPVVLKARTGGYDGRGVVEVGDVDEAASVLAGGGSWLAEARVPIAVELAVVVVRSPTGAVRAYPVIETVQRDGVCTELVVPARVAPSVVADAARLAIEVVGAVGAVGVVAVELFVTDRDDLVVNELALRPHNSGHVTIEACATSQFHNHLRAVLGWPLGDTALQVPAAAMVNVLGPPEVDVGAAADPATRVPAALAVPGCSVHLYRKQVRPGRKLGHVTVVADSAAQALDRARRAAALLGGAR